MVRALTILTLLIGVASARPQTFDFNDVAFVASTQAAPASAPAAPDETTNGLPVVSFWLDGSKSSSLFGSASDPVPNWTNLINTASNFTQATGSKQPTIVAIGSKNAARFDFSDDSMTSPYALTFPFYLCGVELSEGYSGGNARSINSESLNSVLSTSTRGSLNVYISGTVSNFKADTNVGHVWFLLVTNGGSSYWVDGTNRTDVGGLYANWGSVMLGATAANPEPAGARMGEIIGGQLASSLVSTGMINSFGTNAAAKWGLQWVFQP